MSSVWRSIALFIFIISMLFLLGVVFFAGH